MSTSKTANLDHIPIDYEGLMRLHMLRPIHDDIDLANAAEITDHLAVLDSLTEEVVFYGDGTIKYEEKLKHHPFARYNKKTDWYPRAANIGRIGLKMSEGKLAEAETLEPLYLHAKECNIVQKG